MDEVIIVEYDPHWPTLFAAEAARIQKVLGNDQVVIIEHIGSTARCPNPELTMPIDRIDRIIN